jgi:hypothetical protein
LHALPVGSEETLHLARHYVEIDRPQPALDALALATSEELDDPEHWRSGARRCSAWTALACPRRSRSARPVGLGDRELAGEVRAKAHPVLAPVRALWRFGRWRSYFLYLTIVFALAGAGWESLRVAVVIAWTTLIVLPSWFAPRIIRWRQKRRYGGF